MLLHRKLVSVLLVLLMPSVSFALSPCRQDLEEMGSPQSQVAMMDLAPVHLAVTPSQTNRCCQMSPAEIPARPVGASVSGEHHTVLSCAVADVEISFTESTRGLHVQSRSSSPPDQAVLCVFLI